MNTCDYLRCVLQGHLLTWHEDIHASVSKLITKRNDDAYVIIHAARANTTYRTTWMRYIPYVCVCSRPFDYNPEPFCMIHYTLQSSPWTNPRYFVLQYTIYFNMVSPHNLNGTCCTFQITVQYVHHDIALLRY